MTNQGQRSTDLNKILITCVYQDTERIVNILSKFPDRIVDGFCIALDCATKYDLERIREAASRINTPVHVISHKERKGVGHGIKEGFRFALDAGYDVAVLMAGNGKDDPEEIPRLLKPILNEGYDYVQGSRFLPGGKRVKNPFLRGVFSRLFPFLWTLATNTRCTDVTNGFRAYKLRILADKRINIWQSWLDGYELEYYIHYKVLTLGYRTTEVPVSKVYPYRHRGGYSRISPFRDWWKIVGPLVYLRLGIRK